MCHTKSIRSAFGSSGALARFAMTPALPLPRQREGVPENIEAPGPEGDALRAARGQALYDLNVQQYCCGGLNFGYFYEGSPLIAYDGEAAPAYTMYEFTPSTVPGCRTPHLWLDDGRSLYDAMAMPGEGYTLLRFDPAIDVAPLEAAAAARGLPLRTLDIRTSAATAVYDRPLVISRPDQHVAWRGHAVPADALALVDLLRGVAVVAAPIFEKERETSQ